MTRLLAMSLLLAGLAAACVLPDPNYEDTAFSCAEPPFSCPDDYVCRVGVCQSPEQSPGVADAGPDLPEPADAAPQAPADDGGDDPPTPADAAPAPEQLVSFGERTGTDVSGVTSDSYLEAANPLDENGGRSVVAIDADPEKIGLLRFDLTAIPAGAEILGAELDFYVNDPIESGEFVATRLLEDWDESEVNYLMRRKGQLWSIPGAGAPGSSGGGPVASFVARNTGNYMVPLSAALVQAWVSQPSTNFGILWRSTSQDGRGGEFESSESGYTNERPVLRVRYR